MNYVLSNIYGFINGSFVKSNVCISNGIITSITPSQQEVELEGINFNLDGYYLFPGFIDVHVHLREPGFFYKETIESGTKASAHGGYTSVCTMPNLSPAPDSLENLNEQLEIIKNSAYINVYPFGTITKKEMGEELAAIEEMAPFVCGFSDDGKGVQNDEMMLEAMNKAKTLNKIISAHCEDESLLFGGYIHDGEYAKLNNHKGICSESEWKQVERDLVLVEKTGCKYHVCHISTKETVDLIRKAKAKGLDVSCETAPHYLVMNDMMIKDEGRFKMNPPIRSEEDRLALIEGIKDGTIEMIATDHAPHGAEEKSKGLKGSAMGIVGIETAFSVLYTHLVKTNVISLEKLVELLNTNPRERFNIGTSLEVGQKADLTVFNLDKNYTINSENFLSKGKSTPFEGENVFGQCVMTFCGGKIVFEEK